MPKDTEELGDEKPTIKTLKVSRDTWKRLSQMKLDGYYESMDDVIDSLLRDAGY